MKLFLHDDENNSDVIKCVRGIRVLGALWVCCTHVYGVYLLLPLHQITTFYKVINEIIFDIDIEQKITEFIFNSINFSSWKQIVVK